MGNPAYLLRLTPLQMQSSESLRIEVALDAMWYLKVDNGPAGIMEPVVDWSTYPLQSKHMLLAQRLMLSIWTPSAINGESTITSTQYRQLDTLIRLLVLLEELFPNHKACDLSEENWAKIWISVLFRVWSGTSIRKKKRALVSASQPLAKQMFERTTTILKLWFNAYQSGEVSDGPEFFLDISVAEPLLKSKLKQYGKDYEEWKKGGSYGKVPFVIAHLLLADALAVVRSDSTKKMLTFFRLFQETGQYQFIKLFWSAGVNNETRKYRANGDISIISIMKENDEDNSLINDFKKRFVFPLHTRLLEIHQDQKTAVPFEFPWKKYADFHSEYNRIQAAINIIFLSVMGKRGPSEIRTLRGIDITRVDQSIGQNALMRPSIWKSNKGMRKEQGVTNFIDDVFEVALQLGYQDKTNTKLPLFCALPPLTNIPTELQTISIDRVHYRLVKYYDQFCIKMKDVLEFDVREQHKTISSHQFRHSFAEFALRRFDGNVEELIRQHFCHRYNHWWTKRYTEDKLDDDHVDELNQNYIRELVPRIIFDRTTDPEYVGAVALFLKKRFDESISLVTPVEAEQIIKSICEDIIQVTAHEYGWCLLNKEAYNFAKCSDVNGKPNPKNTSVEKCTNCANFCASRKAHKVKYIQITLNHIDFIEQKIWKLPSQIEKSRQAVQKAQVLFPELREYGEV